MGGWRIRPLIDPPVLEMVLWLLQVFRVVLASSTVRLLSDVHGDPPSSNPTIPHTSVADPGTPRAKSKGGRKKLLFFTKNCMKRQEIRLREGRPWRPLDPSKHVALEAQLQGTNYLQQEREFNK